MEVSDKKFSELATAIESFNAPEVRKNALLEIRRLRTPHVKVIEALQRNLSNCHGELAASMSETLETLLISGKIKPAPERKTMVTAIDIEELSGDSLILGGSVKEYCRCNFCGKETMVEPKVKEWNTHLTEKRKFYCTFCLRNRYNTRLAKDVLIASFRGIIGYYYYSYFVLPKSHVMYLSEIRDFCDLHQRIGLQHPCFSYDPESLLWFIDFSRVGRGKRQVPVQSVLKTISEILLSFSLFDTIKDVKPHVLYQRYEEAIFMWFHQRKRPASYRILSPTLYGTGASEFAPEKPFVFNTNTYHHHTTNVTNDAKRKINFEDTRAFTASMLVDRRA